MASRRSQQSAEAGANRICICSPFKNFMRTIECSMKGCNIGTFHLNCMGFSAKPFPVGTQWLCPRCRTLMINEEDGRVDGFAYDYLDNEEAESFQKPEKRGREGDSEVRRSKRPRIEAGRKAQVVELGDSLDDEGGMQEYDNDGAIVDLDSEEEAAGGEIVIGSDSEGEDGDLGEEARGAGIGSEVDEKAAASDAHIDKAWTSESEDEEVPGMRAVKRRRRLQEDAGYLAAAKRLGYN